MKHKSTETIRNQQFLFQPVEISRTNVILRVKSTASASFNTKKNKIFFKNVYLREQENNDAQMID